MRIIAGSLRGRRIKAPAGTATRPTTDRVRESLFSVLVSHSGPELGGGPTLDAFAGSGALGLEALSRGAGPVTFVESDRHALSAIRDNVAALGVSAEAIVRPGDAFTLVGRPAAAPYALILLDPPYTLDAALMSDLLLRLAEAGQIAEMALVSWEHATDSEVTWPRGFSAVVRKRYGTTTIDVARYGADEGDA